MKWILYEMEFLWNWFPMKWIFFEMDSLWNWFSMKWILYEIGILWNEFSMKWIGPFWPQEIQGINLNHELKSATHTIQKAFPLT